MAIADTGGDAEVDSAVDAVAVASVPSMMVLDTRGLGAT